MPSLLPRSRCHCRRRRPDCDPPSHWECRPPHWPHCAWLVLAPRAVPWRLFRPRLSWQPPPWLSWPPRPWLFPWRLSLLLLWLFLPERLFSPLLAWLSVQPPFSPPLPWPLLLPSDRRPLSPRLLAWL